MLTRLKRRFGGLRRGGGRTQGGGTDGAAPDLTLYHRPTCPFCIRVFLSLARLDVPLERRNITTDSQARNELIAGGGRQQVPCLRIAASPQPQWLYESADIIAYLERHFGSRGCSG